MASTTTTPSAVPPSLSLPPSQFARLQPHAYLLAHLSPPAPIANTEPTVRANGRSPLQFRTTSANAGSLTHTNGSAVVRLGDTAAVCGVRAEILHTDDIASWGVSLSSTSYSSSNDTSRRKRRKTNLDSQSDESNKAPRQREELVDPMEEEDDDEEELGTEEDILAETEQIRSLHLLVPNLSLSTGCAPGFIPGAPPSNLAQSLSHQLLSLLHTSRLIRADDLQIWYHPPTLSPLNQMNQPHHNEEEQVEEAEEEAMSRDSNANPNDGPNDEATTKSEIKAFWVLYIDVMIIGLAGNAFDAAWMSVLAALRDTRLPHAWWDVDSEMVLCSDEMSASKKLSLRGLPVSSSFAVFEGDAAVNWRAVAIPDAHNDDANAEDGNSVKKGKKVHPQKRDGKETGRWILADPDGFEESLCQERISIVLDRSRANKGQKTKIVSMEKNGGLAIGKQDLRDLVSVSEERWTQVKNIIDSLH